MILLLCGDDRSRYYRDGKFSATVKIATIE